VRATTYAPLVGARVRHELGGGFALVGEGSLALQFSRGSGAWATFVPLVDPESRRGKLSGNKTGIGAAGSVGVEYKTGGVTLGLAVNVVHSGNSPYLAFADPSGTANGTGGARVGYGSQTTLGASARATFRF
jgi:hypothetical protein